MYPYIPLCAWATYNFGQNINQTTKNMNPVAETKDARQTIKNLHEALSSSDRKSRSRSLAITKLEEASMWLGKDLQELNEPYPYPRSYDPKDPAIDATSPEACDLPKLS